MGDADRTVGLVDVLPTRSRRAISVDAEFLVVDLDLDLVVDDRVDPDRSEARMAPSVRIERRDADEPMYPAFGLQPAIGVEAADRNGGRFEPGFFAAAFFEPLDLVAVGFRPAHVHPQHHLGPVLRFGAAGPGM